MALTELGTSSTSTLRAVGDDWLETAQQRWDSSVMLWPDGAQAWPVQSLETLTESDFDAAMTTTPQVLLLATGSTLRFPTHVLMRALHRKGIGLEVMDHRAAARTFNLLLAEGRRVTALFLIEAGRPGRSVQA
jgi:uncharacterized protein